MNGATQEWRRMLERVCREGQVISPRGIPCIEILGHQSRVDMNRPIVVCPERKLSHRFMCGEAWWITSGRNDAESISRYAKNISRYSDNGTSFFGAYGPALLEQLEYVVETLTRDPDSRQAVVNVWRERPPKTLDVPCTLSWQWLLRGGVLHCNATMRSSDAWLGWVYDVFNFSMVSWLVASRLESRPRLGVLTLTAGSQHIYASDFEKVRAVRGGRLYESPTLDLSSLSASELVTALKIAADQEWSLLPDDHPMRVIERLSS